MKHSTEELLFAAAVRERVAALRISKTKDMTDEERDAFNLLPANDLIKVAMNELNGIATVIAQLRQSGVNPPPASE